MRWILGTLLAVAAACAHATITCSIDSGGFATAYDPAAAGTNITQTFFTVRCSRDSALDAGSVSYSVTVNNGLAPQGQNNRAQFAGSYIRYDTYKDASCTTKWKGATTITGSVSMPTVGQTYTSTSPYWGCVLPLQAPPAGTYLDTITMNLSYGGPPASTASGAFGVTISTPPVCAISSAPAALTMNYTSFGAAANGSTTFGVTCTLALPYTMALDAGGGTILGLNYTVGLATTSSTGTGAQQTHTINGAIAAGQSGTCPTANCTGSEIRGVTVTY